MLALNCADCSSNEQLCALAGRVELASLAGPHRHVPARPLRFLPLVHATFGTIPPLARLAKVSFINQRSIIKPQQRQRESPKARQRDADYF